MHDISTVVSPADRLHVRYTDRPVSGWGGLVAIVRHCDRLGLRALVAVLDLDSTVFERYDNQQGSLKGHNRRKHGRPSHHPLLAMLAEAKVVLHAWLRSGNTGSARGVEAFLAEALAALPAGFHLYAVRADSGFFVTRLLEDLERRGLPYAIAVRMNPLVHCTVAGLRTWTPFGPGLDVADTLYQAHVWQQPRRLVVVREVLQERPDARGRRLIDVPGYTFHTPVTSLELPPADLWRFYNGRVESENRLKELKEDCGADGFCLHSFDGSEAAFRLICFLCNLVADFKRNALQNEAPRLSTVRTQLLVRGAILAADGHRRVLRLGLRGRWREHFEALLARIARTTASTAVQLANVSTDQADLPSRRWRPRPPYRPSALAHAFPTLTN